MASRMSPVTVTTCCHPFDMVDTITQQSTPRRGKELGNHSEADQVRAGVKLLMNALSETVDPPGGKDEGLYLLLWLTISVATFRDLRHSMRYSSMGADSCQGYEQDQPQVYIDYCMISLAPGWKRTGGLLVVGSL